MQHIKSTTNSRNEAYSDYLTTASYDELIAQIRNAEGVVNSEINTDKLDEAIGNLKEKAPVDSDVPTAIKCLYVKISEKSEIFI